MRLQEKVAFVTGAGSGLGRAIAEAFAAEGALVAVNDLDPERAEETVQALPGSAHRSFDGDVSNGARVAEMFEEAESAFGRLDVLVNNAGVARLEGDGYEHREAGEVQLLYMGVDAWKRMLEIHVDGAFLCTREAVRRMLPAAAGSIINMSSIAGLAGTGTVHYATAKGALLGFTRSLARDLAPHGIRVNAICPGVIDTPMTHNVSKALMQGLLAATPLGRLGRPQEIAAAAVYLASDDGAFVTGQSLSPNGGIHIA